MTNTIIRVGLKRIGENKHPVVGMWRGEEGFVIEPEHAASIAGAMIYSAVRCLMIDGLARWEAALKIGPKVVDGWNSKP